VTSGADGVPQTRLNGRVVQDKRGLMTQEWKRGRSNWAGRVSRVCARRTSRLRLNQFAFRDQRRHADIFVPKNAHRTQGLFVAEISDATT
jgi:hypothetical protein